MLMVYILCNLIIISSGGSQALMNKNNQFPSFRHWFTWGLGMGEAKGF